MSYIIVGYVLFLVGLVAGALFNHEEDCPKRVLGYSCAGENCDHRKSLLYTNMARMAQNAEEHEVEKGKNLWGGDNDERQD